jgi:ferredoxin
MPHSPRFVAVVKKLFPIRFLPAMATRLPIVGQIAHRLAFDGDRMIYLPQDRLIPVNEVVDPPGDLVLPSQVVEHFVEQANYHWIMSFCLCRDASHCRDYPLELGCLFLGQATLQIDPRLGRQVTKEEALDHVRRCREAGLVHLIGRNKLDTLWLGVGPGDRLLTICNCCPCCCLWRVLPHVSPQIGDRVARMPGVTVAVGDRCVGCGTCTQGVCFVDAIHLTDGRSAISDACRGCGRCVSVCPEQAIELTIDPEQSVRASIDRLSPLVDVS